MSQLDTGNDARKQIKKIGLDQVITYDTQEGSTKFITLPPSTTRVQTKDYKYEGVLVQRAFLIYGKDPKNPVGTITMTGEFKDGKFVASEVNKSDYDSSAKKGGQTKTNSHYVDPQRQKDVEKWESEQNAKKDKAEAAQLAEKARLEPAAAQPAKEEIRIAGEIGPAPRTDPTGVVSVKDRHGKTFVKEPQTDLWHKMEKGKMIPEKYALERNAGDPKGKGKYVEVESKNLGRGTLTYYRSKDGYNVYFDAKGHQLKSAGEVLGKPDLENRYVLTVPTDEGPKHIELRSVYGELHFADTLGGGILNKEQLVKVAKGQGSPTPPASVAPAPQATPPAPASQPVLPVLGNPTRIGPSTGKLGGARTLSRNNRL